MSESEDIFAAAMDGWKAARDTSQEAEANVRRLLERYDRGQLISLQIICRVIMDERERHATH